MVFLTKYTTSQLSFYAKYRTNTPITQLTLLSDSHPINVVVHMVFVPIIFATSIILIGLTPPIPISSNVPSIHLSDVGVAVYAIGYILLEPVAGLSILPFLLLCGYLARTLPMQYPRDVIVRYASGGNVASWIAQFAGHGLAEGRAPALLDNLFQSLYLAPLFVWLELLFMVGYRPDLKRAIDKEVEADKIARGLQVDGKKTK